MTGIFSAPQLRMEMIDFQRDDFPQKMEAIINRIIEKVKKGYENFEIEKQVEMRELEQLIFDRLGLRIRTATQMGIVAAIIPFYANDRSILFADYFRGKEVLKGQTEFKKELGIFKGTVDEKNAKVGGDFSKYTSTMYYDPDILWLNYKVNAAEQTGIILHELGHAFYGCALSNRMDTANQIIANALRVDSQASRDPVTMIVDNLSKSNVILKKDVLDGLVSNNPITLAKSSFAMITEVVYSQMESGKYDNTSFEQLADNFSARFGYGQHVVSGLNKLYGMTPKSYYWIEMMQSFTQATQIVIGFIGNLKFLLQKLGSDDILIESLLFILKLRAFFMMMVCVVSGYIFINSAGEAGRDFTYDDLVKRYNRIRNQIVEDIKTKKLSAAQAKAAIANYEQIGKLINGAKSYRGPIDFLFNTLNPKDRRAKTSIERQQAIEDLMSNPLFMASMRAELAAAK